MQKPTCSVVEADTLPQEMNTLYGVAEDEVLVTVTYSWKNLPKEESGTS